MPEVGLMSGQQKLTMRLRLGSHMVMQLVIMSARCMWPYSKGYDMKNGSRELIKVYRQTIEIGVLNPYPAHEIIYHSASRRFGNETHRPPLFGVSV
jgi:hypothetical protein